MKIIRFGITILVILCLILLFWHTLIPAIILGFLLKARYPKIVSAIGTSIVIAVTYTLTSEFYPGVSNNFPGYEGIELVITWALCFILFYAGYMSSKALKEGYAGNRTLSTT